MVVFSWYHVEWYGVKPSPTIQHADFFYTAGQIESIVIIMGNTRLDWLKFGIYGFLLSIIASASCGSAYSLYANMYDAFNMLSFVLMIVAVVLLIVGIIGVVLCKNKD
jgi:hypothetical protein